MIVYLFKNIFLKNTLKGFGGVGYGRSESISVVRIMMYVRE